MRALIPRLVYNHALIIVLIFFIVILGYFIYKNHEEMIVDKHIEDITNYNILKYRQKYLILIEVVLIAMLFFRFLYYS